MGRSTLDSSAGDASRTRRLELILRQIEALPTLPAVAARLLALTSDDEAEVRDVIELIGSDQALTSKILSLCRRADMGIREEASTLEKAVVLLGFNTIRSAVLSIQVYEFFTRSGGKAGRRWEERAEEAEGVRRAGSGPELDRVGLWRHCLGVAVAAELLAEASKERGLNAGEAFVCGLLHDIGKVALDYVLPMTYGRVVELAEVHQGDIAEIERRIIGMDHQTAGKRLAEQWSLPHVIQDCIWLHGCPYEALPRLEHRRMIGLVSLADALVRRQHIGYSGNFRWGEEEGELARCVGVSVEQVEALVPRVHEEVRRRSAAMGLEDELEVGGYLDAIQRANRMLGRLNMALERRSRLSQQQGQILDAIAGFHGTAVPGRSVEDVLGAVVRSAVSVLGPGFYATVYQGERGGPWLVSQYNREGVLLRNHLVEAPQTCRELARVDARDPASLNLMGILPQIVDCLVDAPDVRELRVLPLGCGWGTAALLIHDRRDVPAWGLLMPLTLTWGAAVAATAQHDGARRLGEELAAANRALAEAQDRLLESESLARLGEMAAGAAHEMNNPLAVISGRAQLLSQVLAAGSREQQAAQTIVEQARRLSEMISFMRLYADPPRAKREEVNVKAVLDEGVKLAQERYGRVGGRKAVPVRIEMVEGPIQGKLDPGQVRQIVAELVLNALEASPATEVVVRAWAREGMGGRELVIEVQDDGCGMDRYTLEHAFDPFFSHRPAGRKMGFGLARARLLAGAHGGRIDLRSTVGKGTTACVVLMLG